MQNTFKMLLIWRVPLLSILPYGPILLSAVRATIHSHQHTHHPLSLVAFSCCPFTADSFLISVSAMTWVIWWGKQEVHGGQSWRAGDYSSIVPCPAVCCHLHIWSTFHVREQQLSWHQKYISHWYPKSWSSGCWCRVFMIHCHWWALCVMVP